MLSETSPEPLAPCPAPFNLAAHVLARAGSIPDRIALQVVRLSGSECWSYGRLARAVGGIAGGLSALRLPEGSRILLRIGNSVDFPLAFLGAVAAGHLPVACPAGLTRDEVTRLSAGIDPALVIASDGVSLPAHCAAMVLSAEAMRDMAEGPEMAPRLGDPDRPGYLVYTSGTSGQPRAVVHAHRAIWARRSMVEGWYGGLGPGDRMLHAGAMNWTFTLGTGLLDPWMAGATALVPDAGLAPADLALLLRRHDATLFAAAPGIYRQLLRSHPRLDLPRLRHGLSAGERLAEATRSAWEAATGRPVYEAFGMSECSTFISACPARPAAGGTIGHPQTGRRIAVIGPDGAPVPRGAEGVLGIHRADPGLFLTYHGAAAEAAARHRGDWFLSGDVVVMDADGSVRFVGRDDDMMNAGGFRVSPLEVEAVLAGCPGAGEVAVAEIALADGKSVIAAFHTGQGAGETLAGRAALHLAPYKRPRLYLWRDQLPMTATGKVNRRALREERIETS